MNRTYYYIDYRAAIDAIKWRVYLIDKQVQGNTIPELDRKEYFCTRCKAEWTQMEVLDKFDSRGFLCHRCDFVLVHDAENTRGGHEQSTKLNAQFKFITDLLPKIDEVVVPENTFEQALNVAVKVQRDETNPTGESVVVVSSSSRPTAVSGMKQEGPKSIAITLTTTDGPTEADIALENAKKAKVAAQNAMPVHFTHSTISGEQVKFDSNSTFSSLVGGEDKKTITPAVVNDGTDLDDYFARLKAEQAKEAEKEQEDEFETDDEDEDEDFEDVPTAAGTPLPSSIPIGLTSALKRAGSGTASGTSTGVTSPATGPGTPNDEGRPSKKVRIEEPEQSPSKEAEESEEEEMEFENVA